ncbi:MAG: hypothetical protein ACHQYP_00600 [Nitrospiria bacterium]
MIIRLGLIFFIAISYAKDARAFSDHTMTLGSGKTVEIMGIGPTQSDHGESTLTLRYRTSIPLNNAVSLRKEADEIWDRFEVDVDNAGYQQAIVSANEPNIGGGKDQYRTLNFVFVKKSGSWRTYEDQGLDKLNETFVKHFLDRFDWVYDHNEINILLVYLGDEWTATFINSKEGTSSSQTLDRKAFAETVKQSISETKDYYHKREIVKVTVTNGGLSAEVESREIEEGITNGQNTRYLEHSFDIIELKNHIVTITKSTSMFEIVEKI